MHSQSTSHGTKLCNDEEERTYRCGPYTLVPEAKFKAFRTLSQGISYCGPGR